MNQTKITIKLHTPLLKAFENQLDGLCIKRDAFLNHMIKTEAAYLAKEMEGYRLSGKARRYIAGQLKRMGTTTINVVVDKETAEALKTIVDRSNMVRDAFMNRLVMFLRSSDFLLTYLDMPRFINGSEFDSWFEPMPTSPLGAMESVFSDPLYYLRIAAEERFNSGIYLLELPDKLVGFSCFLDDSQVPGTEQYEEAQAHSEEMLKVFNIFERDVFSGAAKVAKEEGK